ncbi:hypothetical protein NIES4074_54680 [Cylindrospermum sp. NIES-4074]|nr:hypothetical protein NIES4074_54680 [Cylindrospermum sp. NIES-4074]
MPQNQYDSDSSLETQAIAYRERLNPWAIASGGRVRHRTFAPQYAAGDRR